MLEGPAGSSGCKRYDLVKEGSKKKIHVEIGRGVEVGRGKRRRNQKLGLGGPCCHSHGNVTWIDTPLPGHIRPNPVTFLPSFPPEVIIGV